MRRSRSAVDRCLAAAAGLSILAVAVGAAADPILDALDDEVDLAEAVLLLEDLLGAASDDGADLIEAALRDAAALRAAPLDLNACSFADLVRVPLIDAATAVAIVARRSTEGPFRSIDELAGVAGIGREAARALRAYLVVPGTDAASRASGGEPAADQAGAITTGGSGQRADGPTWSLRVRGVCRGSEVRAAAGDLANAAATHVRLRVSGLGGLEVGLGCQKDALERDPLDHSAFFVGWRRGAPEPSGGYRVSALAGDFVGSWAQGVVVAGAAFAGARSLPRVRDRTRGYDGASESTARRGLVVEVSRGRASVVVLVARTRLDAAIDERGRATTIRTSGHHRTEGERRGANALRESLVGIRAVVGAWAGFEIGASLLRFGYDPPLASGDPERLRFRFEGDELRVRAADLRLVSGPWRFGVEVANTSGGGRAALACVRVRRGSATVRVGFGHLSRGYWSPLGGGVPGFSGGGNGIVGWVGAEYRIAPGLRPWIALTVAGRPWRSYADELPGGFRSWSGGVAVRVGRVGDLAAEVRERVSAADRGEPPASVEETSRRVRATFRTSGELPLSFFVERATTSAQEIEEGSAIALGVRAEAEVTRAIALAAGVTQSARRGGVRPLVEYEPSLPGEFGLRSLSESGARWYARVVVGLTERHALSLRIGGGPGRERSEIGIALDAGGS